MDPMTARLASLRLAPVQVASWGHPETTGMPTIDYYLSASGLEPEGAQAHYTERLVLLPNLGCSFDRMAFQPASTPGATADEPLLVCPGMPFKYAPQHDWVLAEIARRIGACRFLFFSHGKGELTGKLAERLKMAFRKRGLDFERHVVFLPWQAPAAFLGWLRRADVYLDTLGFSGFNTALFAVEAGLPIVTREGRFLRGRLASGILKRLETDELVARDEAGYVELAVRLVQDAAYRKNVAARLRGRSSRLYNDPAPLRALEQFLEHLCS
jgi:predicted O-linked N-acetylglucosamine transferase (SPINDLY family)